MEMGVRSTPQTDSRVHRWPVSLPLRHSAALPLFAALALVLPLRSFAQELPALRGGPAVQSVAWGWAEMMPAERHAPVRVTLAPGESSHAGALELRYPQDASQEVSVLVPFSTTPGKPTIIDLVACLPTNPEAIRLTLLDARGRTASATFGNAALGPAFPPPSTPLGTRVVAVLGDLKAPIADEKTPISTQGSPTVWYPQPQEQAAPVWDRTTFVRLGPNDLPDAWIAYESLDLLIAREDDLLSLPRPRLEALRTWLESGGRLAVLLSGAGQRWRELAGPNPPRLDVRDAAQVRVGEQTRAASLPPPSEGAEPPAIASGTEWPRVNGRVVRVADRGAAPGWVTAWRHEGAADEHEGLVAFGPAGLGMLMLIGADPALMPPMLDGATVRALWRDAAGKLIIPDDTAASVANTYGGGSGDCDATKNALAHYLSLFATGRSVGMGYFIIIGACMALLAVGAGLGSRMFLGPRGRLSDMWIAGLACIGVAGVVSYVLPILVRGGETVVQRREVIDILPGDEASASPRACATTLVSFFAGNTRPLALDGAGFGEVADGGWWRGVSDGYAWYHRAVPGAPLSLVKDGPGPGVPAASVLRDLQPSMWTIRSAYRSGCVAGLPPAPRVNVGRSERGLPILDVSGVQDGWSVTNAFMVTVPSVAANAAVTPSAAGFTVVFGGVYDKVGGSPFDSSSVNSVSHAGRVPGSHGRTRAYDAIVQQESKGLLFLECTKGSDVRVYRMLIDAPTEAPAQPEQP